MTLQEVITELQLAISLCTGPSEQYLKKALQLGIEALKFVKDWRMGLYLEKADLLPGETKD